MVHDLKVSIREDLRNVNKMRNELELEAFQRPPEIKDGSIALMRHLQSEVKKLEGEFQKRHEDQKNLIEKICVLKKRLASYFEFDYEIHSVSSLLFVSNQIFQSQLFPVASFQKYEASCKEMENQLRERYTRVEQLQTDMKQWKVAEKVAEYIKGDVDLRELLEKNVDSDDFIFSEQVLEVLQAYHQELQPLYTSWLEEIEFRWTEKHQQLEELWEKCLVAPADRFFSAHFEPNSHSEENLRQMTEECERLEKKYTSCRTVFDLVEKWKQAWNEKLGIEEKRRQPDYYKKVNVLPDNKRERELIAKMGVLEKKIEVANRKYEEENGGEQIFVQGMLPNDYIRFLQEEHEREVQFERQLKKEERTRLQSPQPTRTPKTQKRAAPLFRTPMSTGKLEPVAKVNLPTRC